jgi:predicted enzyme related to lactoylglutathione lyase
MSNVINWFEIPVAQMDRAIAFYEPVMQVSLRRKIWTALSWPYFRIRIRSRRGAG